MLRDSSLAWRPSRLQCIPDIQLGCPAVHLALPPHTRCTAGSLDAPAGRDPPNAADLTIALMRAAQHKERRQSAARALLLTLLALAAAVACLAYLGHALVRGWEWVGSRLGRRAAELHRPLRRGRGRVVPCLEVRLGQGAGYFAGVCSVIFAR